MIIDDNPESQNIEMQIRKRTGSICIDQDDLVQGMNRKMLKHEEDVEHWRQRVIHSEELFQLASKLFYKALKRGGYALKEEEYDRTKESFSLNLIRRAPRH